jgi:hypothetical protein
MSEKSDSIHDTIYSASSREEALLDDINQRILDRLKNENLSSFAISAIQKSLAQWLNNQQLNVIERKLASGWIGWTFFAKGITALIFSSFWAANALWALLNGTAPLVSYWWGLLFVPLGLFYGGYSFGPYRTYKSLRNRTTGPLISAHETLKPEIGDQRSAVILFRDLSHSLSNDYTMTGIFFSFLSDRFIASDGPQSPPLPSFQSDSGSATSSSLFKKGFLEAFGGFSFKIVGAIFATIVGAVLLGIAVVVLLVLVKG